MRNRGSALILKNDRVVVIKRNKDGEEYFVFPGGGIEAGETPAQTTKREAFEELGVQIDVKECLEEIEFNGIQYFFLAEILEGEIGRGLGEEYKDDSRGTYEPMWMAIDDLQYVDIRPRKVAERLRYFVEEEILFQNEGLKVRKLEEKDNYLLVKWLSDPVVLEFYEGRDNPFDLDKVHKAFYTPDDEEMRCIIEFDGQEIGYIQIYPLDQETKAEYGYDQDETIYGMDQFIGEVAYWNKGVGTQLVTSMVAYLIKEKQASRVVMDPQTRNVRALRCYEKCGFKKVKLLPERELHEGIYQDCWLIEYRAVVK